MERYHKYKEVTHTFHMYSRWVIDHVISYFPKYSRYYSVYLMFFTNIIFEFFRSFGNICITCSSGIYSSVKYRKIVSKISTAYPIFKFPISTIKMIECCLYNSIAHYCVVCDLTLESIFGFSSFGICSLMAISLIVSCITTSLILSETNTSLSQ